MSEHTQRELRSITRHALHRLATAPDYLASDETRETANAALAQLDGQAGPDLREPYIYRATIQTGLHLVVDASHNILVECRTPDEAELLAAYPLSGVMGMINQLELCRMARDAADQDADDARRAGVRVVLAGGPKDSTDDYPVTCYEVHAGIRPPSRTRGKARAVVFEKVEGGGIDIFTCEHDHAPGVHRCQDISPDQMAGIINCGKAWTEDQIARYLRPALPIVWERP